VTTNRSVIDAYYGMSSPWAYLGAPRLFDIADRHGCDLRLRPIRIIQANGGIPLRTRPKARQTYHAKELARWSAHLGMTLNLTPKFYPCRSIEPAAHAVIAAARAGLDARAFSFSIQRGLWAEDRDIADLDTLRDLALRTIGPAGASLVRDPQPPAIIAEFQGNLADAEAIGIFGTPTYVFQGELFWGQDRLDFLDRALASAAA
jgi:2-hydroxychromene-2-carboxylate isomerase